MNRFNLSSDSFDWVKMGSCWCPGCLLLYFVTFLPFYKCDQKYFLFHFEKIMILEQILFYQIIDENLNDEPSTKNSDAFFLLTVF